MGPSGPTVPVKPLRFPQPTRVGDAPGRKVRWEIVNRSNKALTIVILGKTAKKTFKVGPERSYLAKFKKGGNFKVTATATDEIVPLEGEFSLASGSKYRSELGIRPVSRQPKR